MSTSEDTRFDPRTGRVQVHYNGGRYLVCPSPHGEPTVFGRIGSKWSCGGIDLTRAQVLDILNAAGYRDHAR